MDFGQDNFADFFEDIDCSGQEIIGKEFEDCTFKKCDFSHTAFKKCIFSECRFDSCDLSLMQVVDSQFSATSFENCKMIGVDWTKASWSGLTQIAPKFHHSILNDSSFWGLKLSTIMIVESEVRDVDFREADLSEGVFRESDFTRALFRNTNLSKADFTYATAFDIEIKTNDIKGAKFSRYEALRLLDGLDIILV